MHVDTVGELIDTLYALSENMNQPSTLITDGNGALGLEVYKKNDAIVIKSHIDIEESST